MNEQILRLAQRISDELNELEQVIERIQQGWHQTQHSGDDLYLGNQRRDTTMILKFEAYHDVNFGAPERSVKAYSLKGKRWMN